MQRDLRSGGDMNGDEMRNAEKRLAVTRRERRPAETGGHKRVNDERIESEQKRRTVVGVVNVLWRSGEWKGRQWSWRDRRRGTERRS